MKTAEQIKEYLWELKKTALALKFAEVKEHTENFYNIHMDLCNLILEFIDAEDKP